MKKETKTKKEEVKEPKGHSEEYLKFRAFLEEYKQSNPAKYEAKKEVLLRKLETL